MSENDFDDLVKYIRAILNDSATTEEMNVKFRKFWKLCEQLDSTV